jgi:hypothetical protein
MLFVMDLESKFLVASQFSLELKPLNLLTVLYRFSHQFEF